MRAGARRLDFKTLGGAKIIKLQNGRDSEWGRGLHPRFTRGAWLDRKSGACGLCPRTRGLRAQAHVV